MTKETKPIYRTGCVGICQRLLLAWKYHGLVGIAFGALSKLLKLTFGTSELQKRCQHYKERCFDRRFSVSTAEEVPIKQLGLEVAKESSAVEYSPTSPVWFNHLLSGMALRYDEFTFVDLGSGKGRTLLLASEFPFREVIGVEISEQLHAIAAHNISNFRSSGRKCQSVQSVCRDATMFAFPDSPLVLFLYNPFHLEVLKPVFDNLHASFQNRPRPFVAIYSNPLYRKLFDDAEWLEEFSSDGTNWVVYRSRIV